MNAINAAWVDRYADRAEAIFTGKFDTPARELEATGVAALPMIDPGVWAGMSAPDRQWAWQDWLPDRQATYLTGPGSAGKSLFGQQLCSCLAMASPFLGIPTVQRNAMYVTCEDDGDELHRRQKAICKMRGVPIEALSGKLHLLSLAGEINNELCRVGEGGLIEPTKLFAQIEGAARITGSRFLVLDNVAHLFAGNENIRHEVAAFVALLNRLAMRIDGAVLLVGHPNKAGDAFSGSTAWENQVRSRLFIETPKDSHGTALDRDARVLSRQKSNYAANGEKLRFRWHEWAFVTDADLPDDQRGELAAVAAANAENAIFLACLRERLRQRRAVSDKASRTFAPIVFEGMPEAKGLDRKRLERAMDRLFRTSQIERAELWKGDDRKAVFGLREVAGNAAGNAAPTLCGNSGEQGAGTVGNTHYPLKGGYGAASEARTDPFPRGNGDTAKAPGSMILAPGESGDDVDLSEQ